MTSLASVRSVPVKNTAIPLTELGVRPPVTKEVGGGGREGGEEREGEEWGWVECACEEYGFH